MKLRSSLIFGFCLTLFTATQVFAAPAIIVIIRHGEKNKTGRELSAKGWKRADGLVDFFKNNPDMQAYQKKYGPIDRFYAMAPHGDDGTLRPIQTITPTAEARGLEVHHEYQRYQERKLAKEILKDKSLDGKVVVISWEHNEIRELQSQLGVHHPKEWPGDAFDIADVLKFDEDGKVESVRQIGEGVLAGDRGEDFERVHANDKNPNKCNWMNIF